MAFLFSLSPFLFFSSAFSFFSVAFSFFLFRLFLFFRAREKSMILLKLDNEAINGPRGRRNKDPRIYRGCEDKRGSDIQHFRHRRCREERMMMLRLLLHRIAIRAFLGFARGRREDARERAARARVRARLLTSCMNFLQTGRTSLDRVAENIITCFS